MGPVCGCQRFPEVFGRAVLGRNIDDFISDKTTRDLYQQIFTKVRETQKPVSFDYRCDSPKVMRFITMTVTPGREGRVLCTNTTEIRPVKQTNIPVPASPSMPRAVRDAVYQGKVGRRMDARGRSFTKGLELDDGASSASTKSARRATPICKNGSSQKTLGNSCSNPST